MSIISRIFIRILFLLTFLSPTFTFAVDNMGFDGLNTLIISFANGVVRSTGYMMFTLAVVVFFFGIVQFIWSARQGAEGKGIQRGTQFMKWGLIAIFVMFSVWGIVKFAQGVFGIQGDNTIVVPSLNFTTSGAGRVNGPNGGGNISGPIQANVGCTDTSQCASGLTCVGSNASNKVCTKNGGGNIVSSGNTVSAAQTSYNSCIGGSGKTPAQCQTAYQAAGGTGNPQQNLARSAYNTCIGNGNTQTDCQAAYTQYGGTGSGAQNQAENAYNTCIGNGFTPADCQDAYNQYGGTGSGAQNQAQNAYDTCRGNGYSNADCIDAYTTLGGTGTPNSSGASGGDHGGGGGETTGTVNDYASCMAINGDVTTCQQMFPGETSNETTVYTDVNSYDQVTPVDVTDGTDTSTNNSGIIDTENGLQLDPCAYDPC